MWHGLTVISINITLSSIVYQQTKGSSELLSVSLLDPATLLTYLFLSEPSELSASFQHKLLFHSSQKCDSHVSQACFRRQS